MCYIMFHIKFIIYLRSNICFLHQGTNQILKKYRVKQDVSLIYQIDVTP